MAEGLTDPMKLLHVSKSEKESLKTNILKIASWNVNCLTIKKTDKVSEEERIKNIEDIAEAIKRYKFDIVALQEVSSDAAIFKLYEALNKDCPPKSPSWLYTCQPVKKKKLVFVWNSDIIEHDEDKDLPFKYFLRTPFNLTFKFEGIVISLVNLHLIHRGNSKKIKNDFEQDKLIDLVHSLCPTDQPSPYVFLIGDFNCFPWSEGLEMDKYVNLFPLRMYTNTKQDECYDNIIVPDKTLCRRIDVITDPGLIKVSDHFPICADFHFPTA